MFRHLVLGLLRDGHSRHGYELTTEHNRRSGISVSTGNFYRELQRLAVEGLIEPAVNPPEADARRIPYRITDRGVREFDQWLVTPCAHDADLCERLLFSDRVPPDVLARIMDWWQDELWMRSKTLARAREEALARDASGQYNPLPLLLSRRMKLVAAELEFIKEFRLELDAWHEQHPVLADESREDESPRRTRNAARK